MQTNLPTLHRRVDSPGGRSQGYPSIDPQGATRTVRAVSPSPTPLFDLTAVPEQRRLPRPTRRHQRSHESRGATQLKLFASPAYYLREFHEAFGLILTKRPTLDLPADLVSLRLGLIEEEVCELAVALRSRSLVKAADALADIVYVTYGAALTFGIDLDAVLLEVHRSNMSKLGPDGRPVLRPDGKVLKGPNYRPPEIAELLGE